jgi:hypothetical protein
MHLHMTNPDEFLLLSKMTVPTYRALYIASAHANQGGYVWPGEQLTGVLPVQPMPFREERALPLQFLLLLISVFQLNCCYLVCSVYATAMVDGRSTWLGLVVLGLYAGKVGATC